MNRFLRNILVATGLLIVPVLGVTPRAMAQDPAAPAKEATLVGQCRAANKRTPIYSARNPTSEVVALLETGNAVMLNENGGENGLIGVDKPKVGFVHTPNLKDCPGKPKPPIAVQPKPTEPTLTGICRTVVQPQGLIVRNEAGNTAPIIGSLAVNQKITLAEPIETVEREDGRIWIKVAKPVAGWTSNGFVKQQFRNLGACE